MSSSEIVESFLRGEISRRTLVRRLAAAGVSMSAAVAYSELLRPEWALAAEECTPEFYELYGFYGSCDHYEQPPTEVTQPQDNPTQSGPPPDNNPPPDTTPPATLMKVSKLSLVTLLLTGRLVVDFTMSEAGSVAFTVTMALAGGSDATDAARRIVVARGSAKFDKPGRKRVRLKLTRKGRRVLKKRRRATLRIRARAVDLAGNARVRTATLKLR